MRAEGLQREPQQQGPVDWQRMYQSMLCQVQDVPWLQLGRNQGGTQGMLQGQALQQARQGH